MKRWLTKGIVLEDILNDPQRNNFTFIRLLAALVVVAIHCFDFSSDTYLKYIGIPGVPAFFFISGLLVSASFYRRTSLKNFIWKRILRIYPGAVTAVLFCALLLGPILTTFSLKDYFSDILLYKYISSLFLIHIQFNLPGVLQHSFLGVSSINPSLWSLPLEIKMYLFLVIWSMINFRYKNIYLILLALLLVYFGAFYQEEILSGASRLFPPFLLFTYFSLAPMFLAGMICYNFRSKIIIRRYWIFILIPFFFLVVRFNFIIYSLHFLIVLFLLYLSAFGKRYIRYLTPRADYSYGIYLYAFPIEQIAANYIVFSHSGYKLFLITILLTFPLAFLSWHLVEKKASGKKIIS